MMALAETGHDPRIVQVLLPLPLPEPFDYLEPDGVRLAIGDIVIVPLGRRSVRGVVVGLRAAAGANRTLKSVAERQAEPPLPPSTLEFIQRAARYCADTPGAPLAMALRGLGAPTPPPRRWVMASGTAPARLTPTRARVLAAAHQPIARAQLLQAAQVSSGVVKALLEDGALRTVAVPQAGHEASRRLPVAAATLNASQRAAADRLIEMMNLKSFQCALIDGVTGSGKTEVYLEAAAAVLASSRTAQILVLLPEIALTQAVIDRVTARFGQAPAQWHSGVAPGRRRAVWQAAATGEARIVIGARSALFLPFAHIGLIIVDEEHDGAYKQEDGFIYQARDLAVMRAKIADCLVVLASATPSLETLWNAREGRYHWLRLADRHGVAKLPRISLIDMRAHAPAAGQWLSPPLVDAMADTLARGAQSLLFLNRRGYAPLVLCRACGERMKAPDSDSWLVEHRYSGRLVCHLTGFSMPKPAACPSCAAKNSLVSIGPGVERVEEEARALFPDARLVVYSSDTFPDAVSARALIGAMAAGEYDIMVATQGAAKGHNFPGLTLVGVIDADLGLRGGDLRASERTYQLLTQVSGRAGRLERPGRALVQTWVPDHPVMRALEAGDRDAFLAAELDERRTAGLPPFGRLASIIVSGTDSSVLEAFVRGLAAAAPNAEGVHVFGPADPPVSLVLGRRRKRFLIQADRSVDLSAYLAAWRARVKPPGSIRMVIDVDPYSFL